jgi:hypothetical protein
MARTENDIDDALKSPLCERVIYRFGKAVDIFEAFVDLRRGRACPMSLLVHFREVGDYQARSRVQRQVWIGMRAFSRGFAGGGRKSHRATERSDPSCFASERGS